MWQILFFLGLGIQWNAYITTLSNLVYFTIIQYGRSVHICDHSTNPTVEMKKTRQNHNQIRGNNYIEYYFTVAFD